MRPAPRRRLDGAALCWLPLALTVGCTVHASHSPGPLPGLHEQILNPQSAPPWVIQVHGKIVREHQNGTWRDGSWSALRGSGSDADYQIATWELEARHQQTGQAGVLGALVRDVWQVPCCRFVPYSMSETIGWGCVHADGHRVAVRLEDSWRIAYVFPDVVVLAERMDGVDDARSCTDALQAAPTAEVWLTETAKRIFDPSWFHFGELLHKCRQGQVWGDKCFLSLVQEAGQLRTVPYENLSAFILSVHTGLVPLTAMEFSMQRQIAGSADFEPERRRLRSTLAQGGPRGAALETALYEFLSPRSEARDRELQSQPAFSWATELVLTTPEQYASIRRNATARIVAELRDPSARVWCGDRRVVLTALTARLLGASELCAQLRPWLRGCRDSTRSEVEENLKALQRELTVCTQR